MSLKKLSVVVPVFLLLLVTSAKNNSHSAEKPLIRFGVNLRYQPNVMYERFQPLMDYLTNNTPYKFKLCISPTYEEAISALVAGKTQIFSPGDGAVMQSILMHGAVPILKPLNKDGLPQYRSVIVVPGNSPIRSLKDLYGKRVAFGSHHSISGNLVPRFMLLDNGISIADLGASVNLKNHNAVIKAVLKGYYDAGAVKEIVAERYIGNGLLRVVSYSAPLPSIPLLSAANTPESIIKSVKDALVKLNRTNPGHRALMDAWDEEYRYGFAPASLEDYTQISRMFKAVPLGCGRRCHL